jgi:predicted Na+-dependent transporter
VAPGIPALSHGSPRPARTPQNSLLLPALAFLVMAIVGTGLTVQDLGCVVVYPRAAITGTVAQIVRLPVLAVLLVRATEPDEIITAGLLLLVTCPGGAVSNSYVVPRAGEPRAFDNTHRLHEPPGGPAAARRGIWHMGGRA